MKPHLLALLGFLCVPLRADTLLRNWDRIVPGVDAGAWADTAGTDVSYSASDGASSGTPALKVDARVVQWGGVWALVASALPADGGLRFQAKSSAPLDLAVHLTDSQRSEVVHVIRLRGGSWETFDLPESGFVRPHWGDPKAPAFDPARLSSVGFGPVEAGPCEFRVGPLTAVVPAPKLKDGAMAPDVVQDFIALPASGYGPFADAQGSSIAMAVANGAPGTRRPAARIEYAQVQNGWCGEWIRAGADWTGQDWSRAHGIEAEIYSADPLELQFAFNDANQNAYVSRKLEVKPGAWRTVKAGFRSFVLNPYYQPPKAQTGAPLDLSRLTAFNISPVTQGKHVFWVRVVRFLE